MIRRKTQADNDWCPPLPPLPPMPKDIPWTIDVPEPWGAVSSALIVPVIGTLMMLLAVVAFGQTSDAINPWGLDESDGRQKYATSKLNDHFLLDASRFITGNPVIMGTAPQLEWRDTTGSALDLILRVDGDVAYLQEIGDTNGDLISFQLGTTPRFGIGGATLSHVIDVQSLSADQLLLGLYRPTGGIGSGVQVTFALDDDGAVETTYAYVVGGINSSVNGSEDGFLRFRVNQSGIFRRLLTIEATAAGQLQAVFNDDSTNQDFSVSILTGNTNTGALTFGDPEDPDVGEVNYDHNTDVMDFLIGGTSRFTISTAEARVNPFGVNFDFVAEDSSADVLFITDADTSRVGIGTGAPTRLLHVSRNNTAVLPEVLVEQAGTGDASLGFKVAATGWIMGINNSQAGDPFQVANDADDLEAAIKLTILTDGSFGFRTAAPLEDFHVEGNVWITGANSVYDQPGTGSYIHVGENQAATTTPNGHFIAGHVSVSNALDQNIGQYSMFSSDSSTDATGIHTYMAAISNRTDGRESKLVFAAGRGGGSFAAAESMSVGREIIILNDLGRDQDVRVEGDTDPNLFVIDAGTDTVSIGVGAATANLFTVSEDSGTAYIAQFFNDGNNANRKGIAVRGGDDSGTGTTTYFAAFDGDATIIGGLEHNSGTFQVFDISDRRAKKDIGPTQIDATMILENIPVIEFRYNDHPSTDLQTLHHAAFVAQDVMIWYPDAVTFDDTTTDTTRQYRMARTALVPVLWKALQETNARLSSLEVRLGMVEAHPLHRNRPNNQEDALGGESPSNDNNGSDLGNLGNSAEDRSRYQSFMTWRTERGKVTVNGRTLIIDEGKSLRIYSDENLAPITQPNVPMRVIGEPEKLPFAGLSSNAPIPFREAEDLPLAFKETELDIFDSRHWLSGFCSDNADHGDRFTIRRN